MSIQNALYILRKTITIFCSGGEHIVFPREEICIEVDSCIAHIRHAALYVHISAQEGRFHPFADSGKGRNLKSDGLHLNSSIQWFVIHQARTVFFFSL